MTEDYNNFLRSKIVRAPVSGFDSDATELNPALFDWQKSIVRWSLKTGRAALLEDCGLGKTIQQLEWAKLVSKYAGAPVLILAPLAVADQTRREGLKFGISVNVAESAADIKPGVNVTNYEKLDKFDTSVFSGVVLDESSILKAYTGVTKRKIVSAFSQTQYRLSCSATPAPNDLMELLNQAEFLGVMRSSEALACWFIADQSNAGHYRLRGHAEKDFWRWVSSWAVCLEKPSDIGYSDEGYVLPPMTETDVVVPSDNKSDFCLFSEDLNMSATGYHEEKRRTLRQRVEKCAELVRSSQEQYLVWCYQNDEADALRELIPEAVEVRGSDKAEKKERAAVDFAEGRCRVLISKPTIFGYGLNFQNCRNEVFCGLDYSFESYYQAIRRVYRFGQQRNVNVWRVIGENERTILDTILRKAELKRTVTRSMSDAVRAYQTEAVSGRKFKLDLTQQIAEFPAWLEGETA